MKRRTQPDECMTEGCRCKALSRGLCPPCYARVSRLVQLGQTTWNVEVSAGRAIPARDNHGESGTRLHDIWEGIRGRCYNRNSTSYRHYGAQGIRMCRSWHRYLNFRDWALANGYRDGLVCDRKDGRKNYTPGNCRWVTQAENVRNNLNVEWFTAWGETKTVGQWFQDARCVLDNESTLRMRIAHGWDVEKSITKQARAYGTRSA